MINLIKYIIYLFKMIIDQIIVLPVVFIYYIISFRRKNRHNIIICEHIGDIIYTLGFLKSFRQNKSGNQICVITTKKWMDLLELYPDSYDSIIIIHHWKLKLLLLLKHYQLGQFLVKKVNDVTIVDPGNDFVLGYEYARKYPKMNLKDCIKYGSLELSDNAVYELPQIKRIDCYKATNPILLCPYATVTREIDKTIYEEIASEYAAKGYQLYTNVVNNQQKINGTQALTSSLKSIVEKGDEFSCIIGLRSGILDLLAFSNCPIIAIYPYQDPMIDFFDLRKTNPTNTKIIQYQLTEDINYDIKNIKSIINDVLFKEKE